jgi:hypothetical protein
MSGTVRLGVILLCHRDLDLAAQLARKWLDGGATLCIHIDRKAPAAEIQGLIAALADHPRVTFAPRQSCDWGRFSLVRATLAAARQLLQNDPRISHVYLASGQCLPLRPISELCRFLAVDPDCDHIESVNTTETEWASRGLNLERFSLFFPFSWRRHRWLFDRMVDLQRRLGIRRRMPEGVMPHLGSQWWCLTSRTLRAILDDPQRPAIDRFFRHCWIPDEGYFQTLARRHARRIQSRSLTLSRFDHEGRPLQLYDDQAGILMRSHCFVVRKVWPGATELLTRFPRPSALREIPQQPQPQVFDRQVSAFLHRRMRGRPGLYMQSRFPRKDAENGKTAAPYAVFWGFTDAFPDFESWLRGQIGAEVHGHVLAPESVEFAGRPQVGPGCLSSHPGLRDRDPKGFLTSMIRISPVMQIVQLGPRDNQALNWFMATDPNAQIFAVTGAWLLTLSQSNLPFDELRRQALQLQRVERQQLEVLNSVWVKARVQLHDLTALLTDPASLLDQALRQLDPWAEPVAACPPLRDIDGLEPLLSGLRDSGLKLGHGLEGLSLPPEQTRLRTAAE